MIINAGFRKVVYYEAYRDVRGAELILYHSGIEILQYPGVMPELEALKSAA